MTTSEGLRWAVYDEIHETPGKSVTAIAAAIGVSHKYLLDAANPHLETLQLQARLVAPITKFTGNGAILRAICEEAGFRAVPCLTVKADQSDVIGALGDVAREAGESLTAIVKGLADGVVCQHDATLGRRALDEMIRCAESLKELLAQKVEAK